MGKYKLKYIKNELVIIQKAIVRYYKSSFLWNMSLRD